MKKKRQKPVDADNAADVTQNKREMRMSLIEDAVLYQNRCVTQQIKWSYVTKWSCDVMYSIKWSQQQMIMQSVATRSCNKLLGWQLEMAKMSFLK